MRKCKTGVLLRKQPCEECKCRMWLDYEEDLNCCLVTIEDNKKDGLTLQETAKRIGLSFVSIISIFCMINIKSSIIIYFVCIIFNIILFINSS